MVFMILGLLGFKDTFESFEAMFEFFEFIDTGEIGGSGDKLAGDVCGYMTLCCCAEDGLCCLGLACLVWQRYSDWSRSRAQWG